MKEDASENKSVHGPRGLDCRTRCDIWRKNTPHWSNPKTSLASVQEKLVGPCSTSAAEKVGLQRRVDDELPALPSAPHAIGAKLAAAAPGRV